MDGPWIFGLVDCSLQPNESFKSGEVRLFYVERRNRDTLIPICEEHVENGSRIWSDEWRAYASLSDNFVHQSVNHSQRYVNENGVHSQNIERVWKSVKHKIMKRMLGTSQRFITSHLAEFCWRSRHERTKFELLESFLTSASRLYPIAW